MDTTDVTVQLTTSRRFTVTYDAETQIKNTTAVVPLAVLKVWSRVQKSSSVQLMSPVW